MTDEQAVFVSDPLSELAAAPLILLKNESRITDGQVQQFNFTPSGSDTTGNPSKMILWLQSVTYLLINCNFCRTDNSRSPYSYLISNSGASVNTPVSKLNGDCFSSFQLLLTTITLRAAMYIKLLLKSIFPDPSGK